MPARFAAAMVAASLAAPAALASEYTSYESLAPLPGALQPCRQGMLVSLPEAWRTGDGAVVLMRTSQAQGAAYDVLVSALLHEHAAVLELVPVNCDASPIGRNDVLEGLRDALAVMKRTLGVGVTVAIGYGPGAGAVLEVVRAPPSALPAMDRPRYAAAVALGDGRPAFVLGETSALQEDAPSRLAMLCRALADVVGGMGDTAGRAAQVSASEACTSTLAGGPTPAMTIPATMRR